MRLPVAHVTSQQDLHAATIQQDLMAASCWFFPYASFLGRRSSIEIRKLSTFHYWDIKRQHLRWLTPKNSTCKTYREQRSSQITDLDQIRRWARNRRRRCPQRVLLTSDQGAVESKLWNVPLQWGCVALLLQWNDVRTQYVLRAYWKPLRHRSI